MNGVFHLRDPLRQRAAESAQSILAGAFLLPQVFFAQQQHFARRARKIVITQKRHIQLYPQTVAVDLR